eukprot:2605117-Lingulodinium_polyedra.AAC.1
MNSCSMGLKPLHAGQTGHAEWTAHELLWLQRRGRLPITQLHNHTRSMYNSTRHNAVPSTAPTDEVLPLLQGPARGGEMPQRWELHAVQPLQVLANHGRP